ncbi:hypothetical protein PQX77_020675 [Marasmius sp. AFHP31]|nr:hypothetical protein PQX77_020675 [Marasmius sp. AFHP31]
MPPLIDSLNLESGSTEARRYPIDQLQIGGYILAIRNDEEKSLPLCRWQRMPKEELDVLQRKVQDLEEKQLEPEYNQSTEIQNELNEYRNLLSPIRRLPYEVISVILVLSFEENMFASRRNSRCDSSLLSSVCTHWRMVALSTPSMWSFISCDIKITSVDFERVTPAIQIYLSRSGDATLHYNFEGYLGEPDQVDYENTYVQRSFDLLRLLLEQHYHRVGRIEFTSPQYISWFLVHQTWCYFPPQVPPSSLRFKSLHFYPESPWIKVPALQRNPKFTITSLTLATPSLEQARGALHEFPEVASLESNLGGALYHDPSAPVYTLAHLTRLTLRRTYISSQLGALLGSLAAPLLEVFSIVSSGTLLDLPGVNAEDPTEYLASLIDFLARSGRSLRSFSFMGTDMTPSDLIVVLKALPQSLGQLELNLSAQQTGFMAIAERLSPPTDTTSTILLPDLTSLRLGFAFGDDSARPRKLSEGGQRPDWEWGD